MKPIKNIVFTEKYTNNAGEEKKRYTKVGKLFYNDQYSSFTIKIDAIPVGSLDNPFEGWLQTYDIEDNNGQQRGGQQAPAQQPQYQQPAPQQQYAQPAPQQQPAYQPAAVPANYPPQQAPVRQDNTPTEDDLNKPINLAEIPF